MSHPSWKEFSDALAKDDPKFAAMRSELEKTKEGRDFLELCESGEEGAQEAIFMISLRLWSDAVHYLSFHDENRKILVDYTRTIFQWVKSTTLLSHFRLVHDRSNDLSPSRKDVVKWFAQETMHALTKEFRGHHQRLEFYRREILTRLAATQEVEK